MQYSSTSTMATGSDQRPRDPFGVPLGVRIHNRKLRNIDLVGPFDWKWRYETSPRSDRRSLEGCGRVCACATGSCAISALVGSFHRKCILGCSLRRPRLSLSSPGYLPLLFSYNISIIVFTYGVFAWNTCIVTCIY